MSTSPWTAENPAPLELRLLARAQVNEAKRARKETGVASLTDVFPPGWAPATAAQQAAIASKSDILFFGGAAGSLKTETMLVDAARESNNPNLRGIIFRQQFTEMTDITEKTIKLYTPMGARFVGHPFHTWTFPSGAKIRLAYISNDKDVMKYLGPRYSVIGFDESTLHSEYQIRNMLGRLASTDKTLQLRVRLASNPGNIGAAWHKAMFLKGECPVHKPGKAAQPGQLYHDAVWPSDGYPLVDSDGNGFSVAFIPGRLTDHGLLDDKYVYRLRMMSGSLAPAMEKGCWCKLQGAYFANWDPQKMVIPYPTVGENWWDNHFISIDYGFGKSSAAAHLHVVTQDGCIKTIGEFVASHLPVYEFAAEVVNRFILPPIQGQRRKIVAIYADPANFMANYDSRLKLTGHSVADQINETIAPLGLGVLPASNDRIGGWQLMYRALQTGQWKVANTCPRLIEAIPSRMHDEKKPGDVLKVPGDPLDDVADDARYGIYTFITASQKPAEMEAREAVADLAAAGDLTSASIRYGQVIDRHRAQSQPARLGRRR